MTADNPGSEKRGGSPHPHLDHTGKLAGRPAASGLTGPSSVEGIYTLSAVHNLVKYQITKGFSVHWPEKPDFHTSPEVDHFCIQAKNPLVHI